jgi:voltage-gated sodium channel
VQQFFQRIAQNEQFQGAILALIVINALCMGAEATPGLAETQAGLLEAVFVASQSIFVAEMAVRLLAFTPRFGAFFRNFWNSFDFTIVALSLIPAVGGFTLAARLLRVLRVLRILSVSDRLRGFLDGLGAGAPVIALMAVVLAVLGYVFALGGFYLFGELQPGQWGTLGRAVFSVSSLMLLQDVPALAAPLYAASKASLLFFMVLYLAQFAVVANALGALLAARAPRD